ncbi:tRNA preQ1(34) S-adenosylmethionine ribosyltransferase-isomerase QueA [Candidatus Bandiella numerosa]|uniref:tRNA preQ1(34) S-adenosylmethionine ribosyltransferase-isomerase QueA n=1 Tax=Candidatus Bandiella numerosa TaxID=2570586 RepID=UPI00249ED817|nr:tRNA preQ1(34) S-adenosylmethionine ribosyltransferase-isomerase QueA [Candidatus Bandiella numerosa]WHA04827.1 tRNA preQ1(34) S-adenosylmethionine ribosyltransferase-isomerase QueA [Candidatus Bandiella numerosa]
MKLSEFDFDLPKNLIAKYPKYPRGSSKLLYLNGNSKIYDYEFAGILKLFRKGDLLVLNNSKVIPAYLVGQIHNPLDIVKDIIVYLNKEVDSDKWVVFAKPGKFIEIDRKIIFKNDLVATVFKKLDSGEVILKFNYSGPGLFGKICDIGKMPIPPYFKREPEESDVCDYQTVFAKDFGSVAAPTAGLHFSSEIIEEIKNMGVKIAYIRLDVGAGTFLPVKSESIHNHKMHSERFIISEQTAEVVNQTKREGNRVICVGTTSLRALESSCDDKGLIIQQNGETDIFITPGYKFKIADCLITNFHTPKSTLLMLVSAFSGIYNIKKAYKHAIDNEYRFFSYGDVCWLDKLIKSTIKS